MPLPPVPALPPTPPPGAPEGEDRLTFDMMPIRRELIQQLVGSSEEWQRLTPEERQKIIGEVNQRMLGIVQGIRKRIIDGTASSLEAEKAAAKLVPMARLGWEQARLAGALEP